MDRVATDHYPQSADTAPAAQYPPHPEARASYQPIPTPGSDYSAATPSSARSGSFPHDYLSRHPQYTPGSASMAQATSPSIPSGGGRDPSVDQSNRDLPIDPSIAHQSSPTYHAPYSPYAPPGPHDPMAAYPGHPNPYGAHWTGAGYSMAYSSPGGPGSAGGSPATAGPPRPGQQVYSFVPIPGAQQHKRPRRRYEEIERMYKCGFQGCEKAYGTLNHLNAHVTMQSHGQKRTPEEFKEIRKEWKARKKEEETARKADEERHRASIGGPVDANGTEASAQTPTSGGYPPGVRHSGPQLPPIGYGSAAGEYPPGSAGMYPHSNGQMYSTYPHSPYAQGGQVYPQHSEAPGSYAT